MNGRAVLLSPGVDACTAAVEREAARAGVSPRPWVQRRCERMRSQSEKLGCSCDWERAFVSSQPENARRTQSLFLALLAHDVVYERDGEWVVRFAQRIADAERRFAALARGDAAAIESQRAALGRVDGVELCVSTFGGGDLTVFTPHADGIEEARFVALSPADPQVEQLTGDPPLAERLAAMRQAACAPGGDAQEAPLLVTSTLATVPGVNGMLPVVVTPLVDERFGPTAVLGVPTLDATDRAISARLPPPAGAKWRTAASSSTRPRPAVRYRARDVAISRAGRWGTPVPLVRCDACGAVPVALEDLPVRLPDEPGDGGQAAAPDREEHDACACPRCGGPARREARVIAGLDTMWMWLGACVSPPATTASAGEGARWLPVEQVVTSRGTVAGMIERLMLADVMGELGALPAAAGEAFSGLLVHESVRVEPGGADGGDGTASGERALDEIDELLQRVGADALRLTILYAAAPARSFSAAQVPVRHCERFLQVLYGYAEPRLREWAARDTDPCDARMDVSDKLRRLLAHWCAVGCERVALQIEQLALQRATHNAMLLLTRIMDFESRVIARRGELEARDREAIVVALLTLTRLIAPVTPHLAEELWSAAGNERSVIDGGWPKPSRPRAVTAADRS